jgi:hypothetical protein
MTRAGVWDGTWDATASETIAEAGPTRWSLKLRKMKARSAPMAMRRCSNARLRTERLALSVSQDAISSRELATRARAWVNCPHRRGLGPTVARLAVFLGPRVCAPRGSDTVEGPCPNRSGIVQLVSDSNDRRIIARQARRNRSSAEPHESFHSIIGDDTRRCKPIVFPTARRSSDPEMKRAVLRVITWGDTRQPK